MSECRLPRRRTREVHPPWDFVAKTNISHAARDTFQRFKRLAAHQRMGSAVLAREMTLQLSGVWTPSRATPMTGHASGISSARSPYAPEESNTVHSLGHCSQFYSLGMKVELSEGGAIRARCRDPRRTARNRIAEGHDRGGFRGFRAGSLSLSNVGPGNRVGPNDTPNRGALSLVQLQWTIYCAAVDARQTFQRPVVYLRERLLWDTSAYQTNIGRKRRSPPRTAPFSSRLGQRLPTS